MLPRPKPVHSKAITPALTRFFSKKDEAVRIIDDQKASAIYKANKEHAEKVTAIEATKRAELLQKLREDNANSAAATSLDLTEHNDGVEITLIGAAAVTVTVTVIVTVMMTMRHSLLPAPQLQLLPPQLQLLPPPPRLQLQSLFSILSTLYSTSPSLRSRKESVDALGTPWLVIFVAENIQLCNVT